MHRRSICYVITLAEVGGAQRHLLELVGALRSRFRVMIVVGQQGPLTDRAGHLNIGVCICPSLVQPVAPAKDLRCGRELAGILRRWRPDLVHAHSSKAGIAGRVAARMVGIPAVFTAHGWAFADGVPWQRKLLALPCEWAASRCTRKIITVSEADRRLALRHRLCSPERLVTIYNGIGDDPRRARHFAHEVATLVMVGRFIQPKDFALVVRAVEAAGIRARVLFVGDGPLRPAVEREARRRGLAHCVEFLGLRDDVPAILSEADVFVLASHWEGLPISILEAMRAGLPVVASDVGGVSEAVCHGTTGLLVPRGDVAALAGALRRLAADPELRRRMGNAGRRRYEAHFTLEKMLAETIKVYDEALAQGAENGVRN